MSISNELYRKLQPIVTFRLPEEILAEYIKYISGTWYTNRALAPLHIVSWIGEMYKKGHEDDPETYSPEPKFPPSRSQILEEEAQEARNLLASCNIHIECDRCGNVHNCHTEEAPKAKGPGKILTDARGVYSPESFSVGYGYDPILSDTETD